MKIAPLRVGDTVAVLSPSWCGPASFPHVYDHGLQLLRSWGLIVKEYPTTRKQGTPYERAHDFNAALADTSVKAIIASIGGDDSILVLPHIDAKLALAHPKIIMGYSDSTTFLSYFAGLGLPTFNGPTVMAGLSQHTFYPSAIEHVRKVLFGELTTYELRQFTVYSEGYEDWADVSKVGLCKPEVANPGYVVMGGSHVVEGQLFGGCIEVLEFLKGTAYWPSADFFEGKILFFETSEEKPSPKNVMYMLRNYGTMGILSKVSGILFGIARDYTHEQKRDLEQQIVKVLMDYRVDIPVVCHLNFGHTDPQYVVPLLGHCMIDPNREVVKITDTNILPSARQ
ncbi:MAG TPA: S66 peptidase family protein [Acidobacteriota bacterium]|nr:S66 peptidase family protein [Acidobacteriota bacterium]